MILWSTQGLSALGSSMTSYALIIWSYQQTGSALATSLLAVCSYAPYVFAALCTLSVLALLMTGQLKLWHIYLINALNGLGNTFQQPASDNTGDLCGDPF